MTEQLSYEALNPGKLPKENQNRIVSVAERFCLYLIMLMIRFGAAEVTRLTFSEAEVSIW